MRRLMAYPWPGNVRELQNVLERAVILATGPTLEVDPEFLGQTGPKAADAPSAALKMSSGTTSSRSWANELGHRRSARRGRHPRSSPQHPSQPSEKARRRPARPTNPRSPPRWVVAPSSRRAAAVFTWRAGQKIHSPAHQRLAAMRRPHDRAAARRSLSSSRVFRGLVMLMITRSDGNDLTRTLKLEGKLLEPWIGELESACGESR